MATVGSLFINLVAKVKPLEDGIKTARQKLRAFQARMSTSAGRAEFFSKKIKQARKSLNKFGKRMGLTVKGMAKFAAASVAAGAALVAGLLVQGLRSVDALSKTAVKLGMTTQALAGMQHAASQTGVTVETMNMALQRMVRRIAEAAMGTGEAKGALEELGISAQELNRLSPDQQFSLLADAINKVQNPADRVRLSMKLFDSEGVALVNTMRLGSDGMAKMAAEAEALGLSMSGAQAAGVEKANDAIAKLWDVVTGVARTLAVEMAPVLEAVANSFVNSAVQAGGFGDTIFSVIKGTSKAVGFFLDIWHLLKIEVASARGTFTMWGTISIGIIGMVADAASTLAKIISFGKVDFSGFVGQLEALRDGFGEMTAQYSREVAEMRNTEWPSKNINGFMKELGKARKEMDSAAEAQREQAQAIKETTEALDKLKAAEEARQKLMERGEQIAREVMTPLEKYKEKMDELKELLENGAISQETFDRAMKKAKETLEGATSDPVQMEVEPVVDEKVFDPSGAIGQLSSALGEFKFGGAMPQLQTPDTGNGVNDQLFELQEEGNDELRKMRELIAKLVDNNSGVMI